MTEKRFSQSHPTPPVRATIAGARHQAEDPEPELHGARGTFQRAGPRYACIPTLPPARATGKRVVVVDDDDLISVALERHLRGSDWTLTAYGASEAALITLAVLPAPQVLIVDLRMPRMNGDELLCALGSGWGGGSCRKFLCTTGAPPASSHARAARAGAAVLRKDVLLSRTSLIALLEGRRQATA